MQRENLWFGSVDGVSGSDLEHIGTILYKNEQLGEEGGVVVHVHPDGVHVGAFTKEDGDVDLMIPVADCQSLVELLQLAIRRISEQGTTS